MALILKNVCIDKLYDIVNKYDNTYHRAIKVKPVDVKPGTYVNFNAKFDPRFKFDDHVRISKYKNSFAKTFTTS